TRGARHSLGWIGCQSKRGGKRPLRRTSSISVRPTGRKRVRVIRGASAGWRSDPTAGGPELASWPRGLAKCASIYVARDVDPGRKPGVAAYPQRTTGRDRGGAPAREARYLHDACPPDTFHVEFRVMFEKVPPR